MHVHKRAVYPILRRKRLVVRQLGGGRPQLRNPRRKWDNLSDQLGVRLLSHDLAEWSLDLFLDLGFRHVLPAAM